MKLFFRTLAIVMAALFSVYMVGCGGDGGEPDTPDAAFVSASPADGGEVAANGTISVTFDNNPGDVTVSTGSAAGSGKSRTISGPFTPGALALTIEWTNGAGSKTLNYTVVAADETAPEVTASSPENGAEGVDPAKVFEDGIEITFSEPVTGGEIMLMDGDDDVGWKTSFEGNKATLLGAAGQELSNETEYTVSGTAKDGAGNEGEVSITFTTKAKE